MSYKKILFLDMDGVLNDAASSAWASANVKKWIQANAINSRAMRDINPVNVHNLIYLLKQDPDVRIVISSTWRKHYNLSEMQYMLGKHGVPKEKIVGMTDPTPEGSGVLNPQRGTLCVKWATENNVEQFVCVDDDKDFDVCKDRLVRTNYKNGLTRTKAEDILKLFGSYQEEANMYGRDVYGSDAEGD